MVSWLDKAFEYGIFRGNKLAYENVLDKLKFEYEGRLFVGNLKKFKEEVARASGISERQIHNIIQNLREKGIIEAVIIDNKEYLVLSKTFGSRLVKMGRNYWDWLR